MCRVPWSFDSSEPDCIVFRGLWSSAGNKTTPFRPTPYQLGIATQAATGRICAIEIFMFQKRTYSWRRNDRGERICWTFWGGGGRYTRVRSVARSGSSEIFPCPINVCRKLLLPLFLVSSRLSVLHVFQTSIDYVRQSGEYASEATFQLYPRSAFSRRSYSAI